MEFVEFFGSVSPQLLVCQCCKTVFCGDCAEPLLIELSNGWHVILADDFCSTCAPKVASILRRRFGRGRSAQRR